MTYIPLEQVLDARTFVGASVKLWLRVRHLRWMLLESLGLGRWNWL
jgi:hypothetical protein